MTEFFVVLFAILCVDVTYRICTASARDWKHSKSYCRQCRAETPRWRKLLGLYPDGDCASVSSSVRWWPSSNTAARETLP